MEWKVEPQKLKVLGGVKMVLFNNKLIGGGGEPGRIGHID